MQLELRGMDLNVLFYHVAMAQPTPLHVTTVQQVLTCTVDRVTPVHCTQAHEVELSTTVHVMQGIQGMEYVHQQEYM